MVARREQAADWCIALFFHEYIFINLLSCESGAGMFALSDGGLERQNISFHRWEFYRQSSVTELMDHFVFFIPINHASHASQVKQFVLQFKHYHEASVT